MHCCTAVDKVCTYNGYFCIAIKTLATYEYSICVHCSELAVCMHAENGMILICYIIELMKRV